MFTTISFKIFQTFISFPTQWLIYSLCLALAFSVLHVGLRPIELWKTCLLTLLPIAASLPGGRALYHLSVEHHISFVGEGQSYYGAFLFECLAFWALGLLLLKKAKRARAMDLFAVASAFAYALLRLNCFANGCCYGKLCPYPWAVVFKDEDALTPLIGFPLHPTQAYSMVHGLAIGVVLILLFRRRRDAHFSLFEGKLCWIYLVLLGLGRLVIDPFRGDVDSVRWLGVAACQWSSAAIAALGLAGLSVGWIRAVQARHSLRAPMLVASVLFVSLFGAGCIPKPPLPPGSDVIVKSETVADGVYSHQMSDRAKKHLSEPRNLLFVAVDDQPEDLTLYQKFLLKVYGAKPPRMEEVLWWRYAPLFARTYSEVVQIDFAVFDKTSLEFALDRLERAGRAFDVVLMVHGLPNHLISSQGRSVISWQDIDEYKDSKRLRNLNLVFLQSCFGGSLKEDWLTAGAHAVISFDGFHSNIFFYDIFLDEYVRARGAVRDAFVKAFREFRKKVEHDSVYQRMVKMIFGEPVDEYAETVEMPTLLLRH